jgi:Zn-dependent M28 family amino/carboxypeptidase
MREQLAAAGWKTRIESSTSMGHPIQNLIAWRSDASPEIIVGAHYDTRLQADRDPDPNLRKNPVPGANDGASGVAVLLELARTLPDDGVPIWLVFFDAEDNGKLAGWDWILGSRAFVAGLTSRPRAMILVDMVGGSDLSLPYEANSDVGLRSSVWATAASLGYGRTFIPEVKYSIEDDHLPFVEVGIPAVDIIDINYAYWHTTSDTPEHVSPQSLQIVGDVLLKWLAGQSPATE